MKSAILPMTILLLAAGCAETQDDAVDPVTTTTTSPSSNLGPTTTEAPAAEPQDPRESRLIDLDPQWSKCMLHRLAGDLPDGGVTDALPEGLAANQLIPGHWIAWVYVFDCEAYILDNKTVIQDARIAFLTIDVVPDASLRRDSSPHEFILDAWSNDDALAAAYTRDGFPMRGSRDLHIESDVGTVLRVVGDKEILRFEAPATTGQNQDGPDTTLRWFFLDDTLRWMDADFQDKTDYVLEDPGILTYQGPPLSSYTGEDEGQGLDFIYNAEQADIVFAFDAL